MKEMTASSKRAQRLASFESVFRNLYLNQRVAAKNNLVSQSVWEQCGPRADAQRFRGVSGLGRA